MTTRTCVPVTPMSTGLLQLSVTHHALMAALAQSPGTAYAPVPIQDTVAKTWLLVSKTTYRQ